MNYLRRGLQRTFQSIQKHKILFCSILLLQIVFIVLFAWVGVSSVVKIIGNTQGIIEPLSNATYDPQKIQEGTPFTGDFQSIYSNYLSMLQNIKVFAIKSTVLFLFLNGILWILTFSMLEEKIGWKNKVTKAFHFWLKMIVSAMMLLGPFFILSYLLLLRFIHASNESFEEILFIIKGLLIGFALFYYLFLTALAIAYESSWKKFALAWIKLSFLKIKKTMLLFLIIVAALFVSSSILYAAISYEKSVSLLLAAGLLEITIIVLTRIFWVASLEGLQRET